MTLKNGNGLKGCSYGRVLNQKVFDLKENMDNGFGRIEIELNKINENQTELFNHMSNRMTKGSVVIWSALIGMIGILLGVIGSFVVALRVG